MIYNTITHSNTFVKQNTFLIKETKKNTLACNNEISDFTLSDFNFFFLNHFAQQNELFGVISPHGSITYQVSTYYFCGYMVCWDFLYC